VDEFLVLLQHTDIKEILRDYEEFGALAIPWNGFGSSGHRTKPRGLVIDSYLWRDKDNLMWIKSIINTQFCTGINDPHRGEYTRTAVNETKEPVSGATCNSPRKLLRLNHYFTKSHEEWIKKIARGTGNPNTPPRPMEWFEMIDSASTVYDDTLKDFFKKQEYETRS